MGLESLRTFKLLTGECVGLSHRQPTGVDDNYKKERKGEARIGRHVLGSGVTDQYIAVSCLFLLRVLHASSGFGGLSNSSRALLLRHNTHPHLEIFVHHRS